MSNNQEAPRGFNSIQSRGVKEETSIMFERTIYIMILYIYYTLSIFFAGVLGSSDQSARG